MENEENVNDEKIIEIQENIDSGVEISDDVIAVIAGIAVSDVQGVAGMAKGFAGGLTEALSGKKNLAKGIKVDIANKEAKRSEERRWSERHAAYVCGLGTFGLSKGLITRKGIAGRFGSVVTDIELEPDPREYSGVYDWCINCGACIARCPAKAISFEKGKEHSPCLDMLLQSGKRFAPRYGCGLCQTGVPCEHQRP